MMDRRRAILFLAALAMFRCISSDSLELRGTARLLSTVLAGPLLARGVLLALGAIVLPLLAGPPYVLALALGLASVLAERSAVDDGFGLLGLASVGPILVVLLLGLFL